MELLRDFLEAKQSGGPAVTHTLPFGEISISRVIKFRETWNRLKIKISFD